MEDYMNFETFKTDVFKEIAQLKELGVKVPSQKKLKSQAVLNEIKSCWDDTCTATETVDMINDLFA